MTQFLFEIEDIEGTNAQQRVKDLIALGASASQSYKLKSTTG